MKHTPMPPRLMGGFTLVEMAIVLFIVALLLGGLLPTVSAQVDQRRISETSKQLEEIKEALIGYAIIHGRLPCPASAGSLGAENFDAGGDASNGKCSNFYDGFVPAATLGLSGTDSSGFAIDSWGNRLRYAITKSDGKAFPSANGMKTTGISNLSPDLLVCSNSAASGFSSSSCGTDNALTSAPGVPALVFSTGKNGAYGGTVTDETANLDDNKTFVSHTPTPSPNEFDDIVIWLSPNVLINRMVTAGQLP